MQNIVSLLSLKEETDKELNTKDPQTIGDFSTEYPYGYGFCQCGCGKKTSKIKGLSLKFRKLHTPEKIKERKEQKLLKRKARYIRNQDKRKAKYAKNRDKILARGKAYRLNHPNYNEKYLFKNKEKIKLKRLQNRDKRKVKSREKYYKDIEFSRKNAREKARIYRFENKEKYLTYWRNYSKENREHRRILEKQSTLRFKQTKKYFIPKLISTLKKIIRIKKEEEETTRKIKKELFKSKKQILCKLISILKKIKQIKQKNEKIRVRFIKQIKKLRQENFRLKIELIFQSHIKRSFKAIKDLLQSKLYSTYGNAEKLYEYLFWYISTPKICDFCGISEELLSTRVHLNKKSSYLEIDRKNPCKNYELDNIHLVCSICNSTKLHILTCEEMKQIGRKFILPKWNNLYIPKIIKKPKIKHHSEHLKDKNQFPREYRIWIKLKKRSRKIGKKLSYLSFEDFLSWYKTQDKKCVYCDITEDLLNLPTIKPIFSWCSDRLTIDRISPIDGYSPKNIALACLACNTIKSNIFTFGEMKEIGLILKKKWQNLLKGGLNV